MLRVVGPDTKIIPGHGPVSGRKDLQEFRDMLAAARDRIGRLVADGKTLEQALAARPTADLDARWGRRGVNPDRVVKEVYSDLARGRK